MKGCRRLLPLLALGAALSAPPAASAARSYELHATARSAHGFKVALRYETVRDFGDQPVLFDNGSVVAGRTERGQTLSRRLTAAKGATVTATRRLTHGRVRMSFGARGRVDVRFAPTGRMHNLGPNSCNDAALRGRRGVFRGTVRARMGGVLHTIRRTRLRGRLAIDPGDIGDCSDPLPIGGDTNLSVGAADLRGRFFAQGVGVFAQGVGQVTRPAGRGGRWRREDEIAVHRSDVFTATLTGPVLGPVTAAAQVRADGPFLNGSLAYGPVPGVTFSPQHTFFDVAGPMTGSLTAAFDRLNGRAATLAPATGGLTQECHQCI